MSDVVFTPPSCDGQPPRPIEIRFSPANPLGYGAVVDLCGEHDLASAVDVQDALAPINGNVLVDLSKCEFIDSTIISVLILDHRTRQREGQRLELLVPSENQTVTRTLQISGVYRLLTVHKTAPSGAQVSA